MFAEYPLGTWACERWGLFGEGGGGMALTFFVLPLTAVGLSTVSPSTGTVPASVVARLAGTCAHDDVAPNEVVVAVPIRVGPRSYRW